MSTTNLNNALASRTPSEGFDPVHPESIDYNNCDLCAIHVQVKSSITVRRMAQS